MNFARKQLEKYGWTDGKGLGKHENGISEALKPKLKRSVTGIGHDPAAEFNEHWWSALYDKAAKNVEVEDVNGKTKKIKTKDSNNFVISSSTWKINKKSNKPSDEEQYAEYFVRTAVLTNDESGRRTENVKGEADNDHDVVKKDVFKMTDEELFAACKGRTAHKGARHGLNALGKLARIAQQEQMLLTQPQYEGYSHAKKLKMQRELSVDQMTIEDDVPKVKKKKNKRKHCTKVKEEYKSCFMPEKIKSCMSGVASENNDDVNGRKSTEPNGCVQEEIITKHKKNKRKKDADHNLVIDSNNEESSSKIKNKKKSKVVEEM